MGGVMYTQCIYKMNKENKKEKLSYKIRTLRCSDKTWAEFKRKRCMSGERWEKFIKNLEYKNK